MQTQRQVSASDSHVEVVRGVEKEPVYDDLDRRSTVEDKSEPGSSLGFAIQDSWFIPALPIALHKRG